MASNVAINFNWEKAQKGDLIALPSPFKFGELIGKLTKIDNNSRFTFHTYELFMFGVYIGKVEARSDLTWRVLE